MIKYTEDKIFTQEELQRLFLSVGWISGEYPARLYKALMNSSTVITAWDENKLVGLARVLDDSLYALCFSGSRVSWSGNCRNYDQDDQGKIQKLSLHRNHAGRKQKCCFL